MDQVTRELYLKMGGVEPGAELDEWHARFVKSIARLRMKPNDKKSIEEHIKEAEELASKSPANMAVIAMIARLASEVMRAVRQDDNDDMATIGPKWLPKPDDAPKNLDVARAGQPVSAEYIGPDRENPDDEVWVRFPNSAEPTRVARKMLWDEVQKRRDAEAKSMTVQLVQQ